MENFSRVDKKSNKTVSPESTTKKQISMEFLLLYKNHPACQERPAFENEDFLIKRGIIHPRTSHEEKNTSCPPRKLK